MKASPEMLRRLLVGRAFVPVGGVVNVGFTSTPWSLGFRLRVLDDQGKGPSNDKDRGRLWCVDVQINYQPAWWATSESAAGVYGLVTLCDLSGRQLRWTVEKVCRYAASLLVRSPDSPLVDIGIEIPMAQLIAGRWSSGRFAAMDADQSGLTVQGLTDKAAGLRAQALTMQATSPRRAQYLARADSLDAMAQALPVIRERSNPYDPATNGDGGPL